MAVSKGTTTTTPTPQPNEVLDRAKGFWDRYSKPITYIGGALIVIIGGWYAYLNFIKLPKERKADDAVYAAEGIFDKMASTNFNKDSVNLALNGGSTPEGKKITGLLKVVNNFDGTKSADRAKYMVGACYLQIKEYDKAIKYLKEFDGNGAEQVKSACYKLLGDAYSEKKNVDEALSYYKKAAEVNDKDETFSAFALMTAASYADVSGKKNEAIELYKKLKEKFPTNSSVSSGDVDKHLAALGVLDNN